MPWFIGNDQVLSIGDPDTGTGGLRDPVTGSYLNASTVTATMKDAAGDEVAGQTWPLTLDYVAASDGVYRGVFEDGRVMSEGTTYWVELSIDAGGDLIGFWRWSDVARYRTPSDG